MVGIVSLTQTLRCRRPTKQQTTPVFFADAGHRTNAGMTDLRGDFSFAHFQTMIDHEHQFARLAWGWPAGGGRPTVKPTAQAHALPLPRGHGVVAAAPLMARTCVGPPCATGPRTASTSRRHGHATHAKHAQAMANAPVGDDVYGEDPTVLELERRVAVMCGMEAALFLPSGTMANAVAVRTHTRPGDEIVLEKEAHIYLYEGGGFAALSGCSVAFVDGNRGRMAPGDVKAAIRKADGSGSHYPDGRLICIENTSNRGGGSCYALDDLDAIAAVGRETGCALHVDGARLMNAVVATGTSAERLLRGWDSVAICLSGDWVRP